MGVYFAAEMLNTRHESFEGKLCLVSGSILSQYTIDLDYGAKFPGGPGLRQE